MGSETPEIPREHLAAFRYCESSPTTGCHELSAGSGVRNADYVLYVTAVHSQRCAAAELSAVGGKGRSGTHTAAYAGACARDQYDRPQRDVKMKVTIQ